MSITEKSPVCAFCQGYDYTVRSSASEGCRCEPSQKQIDDYQVCTSGMRLSARDKVGHCLFGDGRS